MVVFHVKYSMLMPTPPSYVAGSLTVLYKYLIYCIQGIWRNSRFKHDRDRHSQSSLLAHEYLEFLKCLTLAPSSTIKCKSEVSEYLVLNALQATSCQNQIIFGAELIDPNRIRGRIIILIKGKYS
jgi:hypothetical protein